MKSTPLVTDKTLTLSLPVRGAWIEIIEFCLKKYAGIVAPRAGSVD